MMDHTRSPPTQDASEKRPLLESLDTHGFNLSSHLQLIESLKADLTPQKVSQILDSAQKLVDEFATLKTQLISSGIDTTSENPRMKAKAPRVPNKLNDSNPRVETTKSGIARERGTSKKRSWDNDLSERRESSIDYTANQSSRKRMRTTREILGERDAVEDFVPVALQKDDISEEVERRLKLKEERRKKLSAEPEKKRKRDSTSSNNGVAKGKTKRSRDEGE